MQDFNDYVKNGNGESRKDNQSIIDMVTKMAKSFDGKSESELIKAIFDEAKKRKKAGTLSNEEIDGFYNMLYPMMDDRQRKMLTKIVGELKRL